MRHVCDESKLRLVRILAGLSQWVWNARSNERRVFLPLRRVFHSCSSLRGVSNRLMTGVRVRYLYCIGSRGMVGGDLRLEDQYLTKMDSWGLPARKDPDIWENFEDLSKWNSLGRIFLAVEGAPGHQNAKVIGSYKAPLFTRDRWDPVVAEVGGVRAVWGNRCWWNL
jgi:hypothetical protein